MSIKVAIIILFLIPHDWKSEYTINITTSRFYILLHIRVSNISWISPWQSIIPLEHCLCIWTNRCNHRNKILLMLIFYKCFNFLCGWEYLINEILCWNFLNLWEFLRTYNYILFHLTENIICSNHSSSSTLIWKQHIVNSNIIQICKSSLQWVHISKLCNSLLSIFKHLLCKNSLWSFIIARCNNLFILLNCCI